MSNQKPQPVFSITLKTPQESVENGRSAVAQKMKEEQQILLAQKLDVQVCPKQPQSVISALSLPVYRNHLDHKGTESRTGNKAEIDFYNACVRAGWLVKEATAQQNMSRHTDLIVAPTGLKGYEAKQVRVDVKAAKKLERNNSGPNYKVLTVECTENGWLFGRHCPDWLAFQGENGFMIVESKNLKGLINERCDLTQPGRYSMDYSDEKNFLYQKRLRSSTTYTNKPKIDVLTYVRWEDVERFAIRVNF